MVARTGIEPVVFALKGQRVNRLHYRAVANSQFFNLITRSRHRARLAANPALRCRSIYTWNLSCDRLRSSRGLPGCLEHSCCLQRCGGSQAGPRDSSRSYSTARSRPSRHSRKTFSFSPIAPMRILTQSPHSTDPLGNQIAERHAKELADLEAAHPEWKDPDTNCAGKSH
jgi:hypothetical protein